MGKRVDQSGPALSERIKSSGWMITKEDILPDDITMISTALAEWSESGLVDIILVSGGTGFSPRDVTPEATRAVIEKETPGLVEAMRFNSLKYTPHAMLSRAIAGIRCQTLIVNLPGNPKAALENLEVILPVLQHAVELIQDRPEAEKNHG